jgi:cysteine desulfurase
LDNAATTAVAPEVVEAMLPFLSVHFGNASSTHGFGQRARAAVEGARRRIAALIGAESSEIVFLSGGTEANNLAILGAARAGTAAGRRIITSAFEHPSVAAPCAALERAGFEVTRLPVYEDGRVRVEDVAAALRDDVALVSVMAANNEVGVTQPMEKIGDLVRRTRGRNGFPLFHVDAVQAVGKIPVAVDAWRADLLSVSGHKLHAPKGIGALYVRKGVRLDSQQLGGSQERARRAGTENVPGAVALGAAADLALRSLSEMDAVRLRRDRLEENLAQVVPALRINGARKERLPNMTNLFFGPIDGESLAIALDLEGVAVSTGSACSSGSTEPSAVLTAMGFSRERIRGSLRLSLSRYTTDADVARVSETIPKVLARRFGMTLQS